MLDLQIVYLVFINVQLVKYKLIIVKVVKEIDMRQLVDVLTIIMKIMFQSIVLNVIINVYCVKIIYVQHVQIEE